MNNHASGSARRPIQTENIPACLRRLPQWVGWKYVERDGKQTKCPVNPKTGGLADSTDPATWGTFDEAVEACRKDPGLAGFGFVFAAGGGYCGVDLDDCIDPATGELKPWGRQAVAALDSYTEVSPSGTGVKVFLWAKKPGPRCRKTYHDGGVEVYDAGRFFTVTGWRLSDVSAEVEERQDALAGLYRDVFGTNGEAAATVDPAPTAAAQATPAPTAAAPPRADLPREKLEALLANDHRFAAIWDKKRTDLPSQSEYDLALAGLAAAAGCSDAEIAALILAHRRRHGQNAEKALRPDYVCRTIRKAKDPAPLRPPADPSARFVAPDSSGLVLALAGQPRRTPTRTGFRIEVSRGGESLGRVTASDSSTGIRNAARDLCDLLPEGIGTPKTVRRWLPQALAHIDAQAQRLAADAGEAAGETMLEALADFAAAEFGAAFRDADGRVWSERQRRWLRRQDLLAATPPELLLRLKACADAPRNAAGDVVNDSTLVYHVTRLLGVVWAGLLRDLPVQEDAEGLAATSGAATEFRRAVIRLWTAAKTWTVDEEPDVQTGVPRKVTARASMLSRARQKAQFHLGGRYQPAGWSRILTALDAWWKVTQVEGSRRQLWLAMRYTLPDQVGVPLPGVVDQRSLAVLASRYGVAGEDGCAPSGRLGGRTSGGAKILVLSRELIDELLAEPADEDFEGVKAGDAKTPASPRAG